MKAVELFKFSLFSTLVISAVLRIHFHSNRGKEWEWIFFFPSTSVSSGSRFPAFHIKCMTKGEREQNGLLTMVIMGLIHSWLLQFCLSFIPSVGHSFPYHLSFRSRCKVCLNFCFVVWATLLLLSGLALTLNTPISTSCLGWVTKEKYFIYSTPLLFSCFKPSNSSFIEKKQCIWQVTQYK